MGWRITIENIQAEQDVGYPSWMVELITYPLVYHLSKLITILDGW